MSDMVVDMLADDGKVRCPRCTLEAARYADNGNIAIRAVCEDGEPWGVLTVNPGLAYGDDRICVKDYSEGSGNLRTLRAAGLVDEPVDWVSSGFVVIPVCPLTEKGRKFVAEGLAATKQEKADESEGEPDGEDR